MLLVVNHTIVPSESCVLSAVFACNTIKHTKSTYDEPCKERRIAIVT